ncbi:MAG TPA: hypothetical protein PK698_02315 [Bacilli bacterium]|jgi:hypothetical protein|nr:hypothetical protein [Bacilli bacterium]
MDTSKKISPEVLIYIQNLKQFFSNNKSALEYFDIDDNFDEFYEQLANISQKNFDETGEPELSIFQLETLRHKIANPIQIKRSDDGRELLTDAIFLKIGNFDMICLN